MKKFILPLLILFATAAAPQQNSQEIIDLLKGKEWARAEVAIDRAIRETPEKEWLYTNQTWVLQNLKKYDKAISVGRVALKKWPNSEKTRTALSRTLIGHANELLKQNRPAAALAPAKEALSIAETEAVYAGYGNVRRALKEYKRAVDLHARGLERYPDSKWLAGELGFSRFKYAQELQKKGKLKAAHEQLEQAYAVAKRDYLYYQLAVSHREQGDYSRAIEILNDGKRRYSSFVQFEKSLPYTRYLHYQSMEAGATAAELREQVEATLGYLSSGARPDYHYLRIVNRALRKIGDINYFESTYRRLLARFGQEPSIHDDYGFGLYVHHRLKGPVSKEIKSRAIASRRTALRKYTARHGRRRPVSGLPFPLKGRFVVWSEFGGTAMTHNGFGHYCYDFAAVNPAGEIKKPGAAGKKNEDYYMFNQPIYAVADGVVESLREDLADNRPGDYAAEANTVTIDHGDYYSFYAHLKQHSIEVRKGQRVQQGARLGAVGNSGMSTESHLHFCLRDKNQVASIPYRFRPARVWKAGVSRTSADFYRENEIVEFD